MIELYDNPFSPFARKVRMALQHKGVTFQSIDALAVTERERLLAVNPRGEVPVLVDDRLVVANSADIVEYLEDLHPTPALLPPTPELRARARYWQRMADTVLDAVIHDISLWMWPTHRRGDQPPVGLLEAGRRDLEAVLVQLDKALDGEFVCGDFSLADLALFPHVSTLRLLGVSLGPFREVSRWNRTMRSLPLVRADLEYVKKSMFEKFGSGASPYETEKIVWRGDRIEWLLANGFQNWFRAELDSGRAVVPRSL